MICWKLFCRVLATVLGGPISQLRTLRLGWGVGSLAQGGRASNRSLSNERIHLP